MLSDVSQILFLHYHFSSAAAGKDTFQKLKRKYLVLFSPQDLQACLFPSTHIKNGASLK